jgi:hypothetical protein
VLIDKEAAAADDDDHKSKHTLSNIVIPYIDTPFIYKCASAY